MRKHIEISDNLQNYILQGENHRIRCQRVLNLLIAYLDNTKDYMNFCYLLSIISVFSELPYRLIAGKYVIAIVYLWNGIKQLLVEH